MLLYIEKIYFIQTAQDKSFPNRICQEKTNENAYAQRECVSSLKFLLQAKSNTDELRTLIFAPSNSGEINRKEKKKLETIPLPQNTASRKCSFNRYLLENKIKSLSDQHE